MLQDDERTAIKLRVTAIPRSKSESTSTSDIAISDVENLKSNRKPESSLEDTNNN